MDPGRIRSAPPPRGARTQALSQAFLKELLRSGARPGDRLPTEHELARRFGVSRPTVRQALKSLDAAGLVESRPRRGTVLKHADPRSLGPWFAAHVALAVASGQDGPETTGDALRQLAEARWLFERGLTDLVAKRRNEADLAAMQKAVGDFAAAMDRDDRPGHLAADAAFHRAFAAAAHNSVLQGLSEVIDGYFEAWQEARKDYRWPSADRIRRTLNEHEAILEAVRAQEGSRVLALLDKHFQPIFELLDAEERT